MAAIKLELTDCLTDSPQTRALLKVFEDDAECLTNYARGVNYAFERIASAQQEVTAATQALSQHLRNFDKYSSTLASDNNYISSALQEFAEKVDQVATFNAILQTQVAENAAFQSRQFLETYLSDIESLKVQFHSADSVHIEAMKRLAKLSRKRAVESNWQEATDHLHAARKGFHVTSMTYCSMLNILQSSKKTGLINPLVGYMQSQIGHFQMGVTLCGADLENYLKALQESMQEVEKNTDKMSKENAAAIDLIDAESTRAYIPDPPPSMNFPDIPVDVRKTQISGYLFSRSTGMFTNQWVQRYYFTQGGNLMQQGREEVAGSLVIDLDGCSVAFADIDDRRYVFQVLSQDGKHSVVLQAESSHGLRQWVTTITNISKGLYLANDPGRAAELMHAAANAVEPVSVPTTSASPQGDSQNVTSSKASSEADHVQAKQEQAKPTGMFARLKNAASSLVAPLNKMELDKTNSEKNISKNDNQSRSSKSDDATTTKTSHPVLFDLPCFTTQEDTKTSLQSTPEKSSVVQSEDSADDSSTAEEGKDNVIQSNFNATYVVRFLGCREVTEDAHYGYTMISETIRSAMAARAFHNNFSVYELHMVLTDYALTLVDPGSQMVRDWFSVSEILMAANHRENSRLIGIIARRTVPTSNSKVNMCYVFESDSDGADVCCSIATVQVMAQSLVEESQIQQQRELESDLEEQSRLLAQTDTSHAITVQDTDPTTILEQEDLTMRDSE